MHRLFLPPEQFSGETATIVGSDHLHLARVLRARTGDTVTLLDNRGNAFQAVLVTIGKAETTARIEGRIELPPEPPVAITVAQALGKGDKFEQVVQHGTEAGASAFVPVRAERCVADIPAGKIAERVARWQQIAKGAAEQSGRARIPEVAAPMTFAELLREAERQPALLLHPTEEAMPLAAFLRGLTERPSALLLAVGPEGGWSPAEVSAARAANLVPVRIGPRILRTETAALVALSQILYEFEFTPPLENRTLCVS
jgi:16S rRNA (uracil1498-N3)-methyltransferase